MEVEVVTGYFLGAEELVGGEGGIGGGHWEEEGADWEGGRVEGGSSRRGCFRVFLFGRGEGGGGGGREGEREER